MNNDFPYIKELQGVIQDVMECGATEAVVAGGAVRDMLTGRSIKDIDVFYLGKLNHEKVKERFTFPETVKKKEKGLTWTGSKIEEITYAVELPDDDFHYTEDDTWQVSHKKVFKEGVLYPIQFIQVKEGSLEAHVFETFGVNLSKVVVTTWGLIVSNEFLAGEYFKSLDFSADCYEGYVSKIKKKYPDFECSNVGLGVHDF